MSGRRNFIEQFAFRSDFYDATIPNQSVVEIAGDRRVLIENHLGINGYSDEMITVKVGFGSVCVRGCGLKLMQMTKEQLIICGRIEGITLQRRRTP